MADIASLKDPGLPGETELRHRHLWLAAGLSGAAQSVRHLQHTRSRMRDQRMNVSAFADLGATMVAVWSTQRSAQWPHLHTLAAEALPLAVFSHGNHTPLRKLTTGYLYLVKLLALPG